MVRQSFFRFLKNCAPSAGFTLVEVLVTVFCISIMLVGFQATTNTALLIRHAKHQDRALRLAATEIDNLRALGHGALPSSGTFTDPALTALPLGQGARTITALSDSISQVAVVVMWQEPPKQTGYQVELTTIIAEGGL